MKTEKKLVSDTVFRKIANTPILFKDIDIELHDEDVIQAGYDEGFQTENNSVDPYFYLEVQRERLETDEEYEKRIKRDEHTRRYLKERRYQNYLKLKDEFENGVENNEINVVSKAVNIPKYCRFCGKLVELCTCDEK